MKVQKKKTWLPEIRTFKCVIEKWRFFLCGMLWHLIQFFICAPGWGAWSPFFASLSFFRFTVVRAEQVFPLNSQWSESRSDWVSRRTHAGIGCWWTARRISRSRACCCRCRCSRTTATGWGLATACSWASSLYLQGRKRESRSVATAQVVTVQTFLVVQCVFTELSLTVED